MSALAPTFFLEGQSVLASGSLVTYGTKPIRCFPLPPPNHLYTVELTFPTPLPGMLAGSVQVVSQNHVQVVLPMFGASGPNGLSYPLYVANFDGKRILLHIVSELIGTGDTASRLTHYTFVDGGPVGA